MQSVIRRPSGWFQDLPAVSRRKLVILALLRAGLTVTVLITVYYLVPLNRWDDAEALVTLLVGLVASTGIIAWQTRAIIRSPVPLLRAIQTLAVGLPLILLIFATTYVVLADNQPLSFTEPLSRSDSLYFTVSVFATVGFGDIAPDTEIARLIVTGQMIMNLVVLGGLVRVIFGAVQVSVQRRSGGDASDDQS